MQAKEIKSKKKITRMAITILFAGIILSNLIQNPVLSNTLICDQAGYMGERIVDIRHYNYLFDDEEWIQLQNRRNTLYANGELFIINIHGKSPEKYCAPPTCYPTVRVNLKNRKITLLLISNNPAKWNISIDDSSKIEDIIIISDNYQKILGYRYPYRTVMKQFYPYFINFQTGGTCDDKTREIIQTLAGREPTVFNYTDDGNGNIIIYE